MATDKNSFPISAVKVSELPGDATINGVDTLYVVDSSDGTSKKMTIDQLLTLASGTGAQNNYSAITAPTVTDDISSGYAIGSVWVDTVGDSPYILVDGTIGAAVWAKLDESGGAGIDPADQAKLDNITVTQAVDLDVIEGDTATNKINADASKIKTDFITVTQAVDLDTMESDVALNNAKVGITPAESAQILENETNADASKLVTDHITVTQAVNLDEIEADVADLTTLSGVASNATNLGTFNGEIIPDNTDIKTALESLEENGAKNNNVATTAPSATDDESEGYSVGSVWVDTFTNNVYTLVDATDGAAVWEISAGPLAQATDETVSKEVILGEDITVSSNPIAVMTAPRDLKVSETEVESQETGDSDAPYPKISNTKWQSFTYTPTTIINHLTQVAFGNLNLNVVAEVEVYATDGSQQPTGPMLDKMIASSYTLGSNSTHFFDSTMYPTLTNGVKYSFVIKGTTSNEGTSYVFDSNTSTAVPISDMAYTTNSGASWTVDSTSVQARSFRLSGCDSLLEKDRTYIADKNVNYKGSVDGFLTESGLKDDVIRIISTGTIGGFSGLTPDVPYYLSTLGAISTTDDGLLNDMKSLSATEILLQGSPRFSGVTEIAIVSSTGSGDVDRDGFLFGEVNNGTLTVELDGYEVRADGTDGVPNQFCYPVSVGDSWSATGASAANQIKIYFKSIDR